MAASVVIPVSDELWPVSGLLLAAVIFWGFSFVLFVFILLVSDPRLAQSKALDGRSPAVLANHLTSFLNTGISVFGAVWGLNSLAQSGVAWGSAELVVGPLIPNSGIFYINFAAFCIYDLIWVFAITRPVDRLMILHHVMFFTVSLVLLEENFLPAIGPVLLLQEISNPFVNLHHAFTDFGVKSGLAFFANSAFMTLSFFLFRVVLMGAAVGHIGMHWHALNATLNFERYAVVFAIFAGYCLQLFWFSKIASGLLKFLLKGSTKESQPLVDDRP